MLDTGLGRPRTGCGAAKFQIRGRPSNYLNLRGEVQYADLEESSEAFRRCLSHCASDCIVCFEVDPWVVSMTSPWVLGCVWFQACVCWRLHASCRRGAILAHHLGGACV